MILAELLAAVVLGACSCGGGDSAPGALPACSIADFLDMRNPGGEAHPISTGGEGAAARPECCGFSILKDQEPDPCRRMETFERGMRETYPYFSFEATESLPDFRAGEPDLRVFSGRGTPLLSITYDEVNSSFLERGRRDPWTAGFASLVIPGAGQIYNAFAPHAFTLRGFGIWMYVQGGAHILLTAAAVFNQFKGLKVQYVGGTEHALTEREGQTWRLIHAINAVVAAASAFFEARLVNGAGARYFSSMKASVFVDPETKALGFSVGIRF